MDQHANATAHAPSDPTDLAELQYPELNRRRKALDRELEDLIDTQMIDGDDAGRQAIVVKAGELGRVAEALARKRAGSLGKGGKHQKKGAQDGADESADADRG